jgi:ABC-2 type transport system permease protein
MRRILIIAETEFLQLVKTKAFIIGILIVPVMMVAFISFMNYAEDHIDVTDRTIAVIDGTGAMYDGLAARAAKHNLEAGDGEAKKDPHFLLRKVDTAGRDRDAVMVELSEQVRKKELFAFVEIPPGFFEAVEKAAIEEETMTAAERKKKADDDKKDPASTIHFYAMTSSAQPTTRWLVDAVNGVAAERRFASAGVDKSQVIRMTATADLVRFGLVERGADGNAVEAKQVDDLERIGLPMFVLVLMFMSVMTGAMHLLNAVIEEKISKISEVLLGSVTPVELLTGKLLGVVGVSLVLTAVYLVGGIYTVISFGRPDLIDPVLIGWFLLYLVCASLMFGSIFLAIGSACSNLKDSQSMIQPAMMLIILAYLGSFVVMRAPESGLAMGMSLFPTIAPFAMMLRLALPPGPPLWQVLLSVVLVVGSTGLIIWAAARIFRVGLLMQGKPPNLPELLKWVWR